jgi:hypothetical protein
MFTIKFGHTTVNDIQMARRQLQSADQSRNAWIVGKANASSSPGE